MAHEGLELQTLVERPGLKIGIVAYGPGVTTGEPATHSGDEFVYVLAGAIEVVVEARRIVLRQGDYLSFDASKRHQGRNIHDGESRLLFVIAE